MRQLCILYITVFAVGIFILLATRNKADGIDVVIIGDLPVHLKRHMYPSFPVFQYNLRQDTKKDGVVKLNV